MDIGNILEPFFGQDNGDSVRNRRLKSDFNLQVSVPIVLCFLELLKENKRDFYLSYSDIFGTNPPTNAVLLHFKQEFGFELSDIQWTYKKKIISDIVEKHFIR